MNDQNEPTLKEINHFLLDLESDLNLFEKKTDGIYYWERVRHSIHKKVIKKVQGFYSNTTSGEETEKFDRPKEVSNQLAKGIKNAFVKNPYVGPKSDIVFYGKGRRRQLNDRTWYDIHLDPIVEYIDKEYTFIEPTGGPPEAFSDNRRYLMFPRLVSNVAQKLGCRYELPEKDESLLREFEFTVENEFGVTVDAISKVERELSNRQLRLPLYQKVIEQIDPEVCFMTYGHSHHSTFIEACHDNSVTVVDVQYCAVDPNYWPYHYPGEQTRRVKPDYLFLWGEFWKEAAALPCDDDEIYVTGFPYFERQLKKYESVEKKNQLLFISNSKSGPHLSKFAARLAELDIEQEIVYKLHGGEFDTWRTDYPELAKSADQGKLTVLDEVEGSLHKLLAESQAQVGVSSTALYEGLGFNLPTYILNVPYSYEMKNVIETNGVELVDDVQILASKLKSLDVIFQMTDFFFIQGSEKQLSRVLPQIL